MTSLNIKRDLFYIGVMLCMLITIIILSISIIDYPKAYAMNTRGVVSYEKVLNENERLNYKKCLECYNKHENKFEVDTNGINEFDELWLLLNKAVVYDNPIHSIRKANLSNNDTKLIKDDGQVFIKIENEETYNYKEVYEETISRLDYINEIHSKEYITDKEYVQSIYNYIIDNCEYNLNYNNIYEVTINKKSACLGITSSIKYLLDKNLIPNFIAEGYIDNNLHVWNEVYIEGKWYLLDATGSNKTLTTLSEINRNEEIYILSDITKRLINSYNITL